MSSEIMLWEGFHVASNSVNKSRPGKKGREKGELLVTTYPFVLK